MLFLITFVNQHPIECVHHKHEMSRHQDEDAFLGFVSVIETEDNKKFKIYFWS